jgi:hypothetical protein
MKPHPNAEACIWMGLSCVQSQYVQKNDREAGARARRDSNRRGGSVERLPTERCNGDCCTRRRSVHDPEFLTSHIGAVGESDRASRYWMFAIM